MHPETSQIIERQFAMFKSTLYLQAALALASGTIFADIATAAVAVPGTMSHGAELSQALTSAQPMARARSGGGAMRGQRSEQRSQRAERRSTASATVTQNSGTRVARRTSAFEAAATVEASDVQARLDSGQEAVLNALANADTAAITQTANAIGAAADTALKQAPGTYASQEQIDTLVAAAARASTITEDEVAQLLNAGSLAIKSYEGLDAEAIATNLNTIGSTALDLQAQKPTRP